MGAKPNRKSRHGLHRRVMLDFEACSLYPHQRGLLEYEMLRLDKNSGKVFPYEFDGYGTKTGRTSSEPEIQRIVLYRYKDEIGVEVPAVDFSEAELRVIAQAGIDISAKWDKRMLGTLYGVDFASEPDRTGYSVFDPARYRKD